MLQVGSERFSLGAAARKCGAVVSADGVVGLWKGHSATLLRILPYAGAVRRFNSLFSCAFGRSPAALWPPSASLPATAPIGRSQIRSSSDLPGRGSACHSSAAACRFQAVSLAVSLAISPAISAMHDPPKTSNPKPETRNLEPETCNPKPETLSSEPSAPD